jgi:4-diphosphocytidyl-2-C-methyl-D-erythritol kinase
LRLLDRCWGVSAPEPELRELAASLGADVPACLRSETAWGWGRGDELEPAPDPAISGKALLLVNPLVPVPTGPVFAGWDRVDRGPLERSSPLTAAVAGRNDLEAPAIAIAPVIGDVLELLRRQAGTTLVRMSGSGATCFALFDTEAARDTADAAIAAAKPAWWRLPTCLR